MKSQAHQEFTASDGKGCPGSLPAGVSLAAMIPGSWQYQPMSLVQQITPEATPERILIGLLALMVIALGILSVRLRRDKREGSDLEKQQEELRELSIALANAVEGVTRLDARGRFTFVNRAYADSIGYEPEEIVGRDWRMTIQERNHPHIIAAFQQMVAEGRAFTHVEGRHRNGSTVHGELTLVAIRDRNGKHLGHYGFTRNVSERTRAEEQLRASEARLAEAQNIARLGSWEWNIATGQVDWSRQLYEVFGVSRSEFVPGLESYLSLVHPEDRERMIALIQKTVADASSFVDEHRVIWPNGSVRHLAVRGVVLRDENDIPSKMAGTVQDITEHRDWAREIASLNRENQRLLNSVADGMFGIDLQGRATFVNPAGAGLLGYEVEDLLGKDIHAMVHHSDRNGKSYPWEKCPAYLTLHQGTFQNTDQEVFWRRDGSSFPTDLMSSPLHDEEEKVVGAVVTFRDITDRYEINRMKSEFVSTVSHELRTPLTSIRGSLGLLTAGVLGEVSAKGRRMLEIAVNNTDRLIRLINDILDIERLESGRVAIIRKNVDASELMDQAAEVMRTLAEKAGVTLRVIPYAGAIWADQDRMVQTLTNLLSNGVKFSPRGGLVTLRAVRQEGMLRFEVTDQGRGIPADKLETIFDRFQQVDASDAREKGGTGLGLAICRSIVSQHGGRIWAESQPGQGSTFSFTIPFAGERTDRLMERTEESDNAQTHSAH